MNTKMKITLAVIAVIIMLGALLLLLPIEKKRNMVEKYGHIITDADTDEKAKYIVDHIEEYPDYILQMYYLDDRYIDFVYNYPEHKNDYDTMKYTDEEISSDSAPKLYMYDKRWCYERIGDNFIRTNGCMAVSLTMAYIGLYHKDDIDPKKIADIAKECDGLAFFGGISDEHISDIIERLGIKSVTHYYDVKNGEKIENDKTIITNILDNGGIPMLGMYGETFGSHAVVVSGYTDEGLIINDPASEEKSNKIWSFESIAPEICYVWELYKE